MSDCHDFPADLVPLPVTVDAAEPEFFKGFLTTNDEIRGSAVSSSGLPSNSSAGEEATLYQMFNHSPAMDFQSNIGINNVQLAGGGAPGQLIYSQQGAFETATTSMDLNAPIELLEHWDCPPSNNSSGNAHSSETTSGEIHSGGAKKVGRPRIDRPATAGATKTKAKTRGPKPKYVFQSCEEAANARRERNRQAALESYYKKRQHVQTLEAEIAQLKLENEALAQLHQQIVSGAPHSLLEPTESGVNDWLKSSTPSS